MNKKQRKLLSLLITGTLILSMFSSISFPKPAAAEVQTEETLSFDQSAWTYKDKTDDDENKIEGQVEITGFQDPQQTWNWDDDKQYCLKFPDTLDGKTVTSINLTSAHAYRYIVSVDIPSTVTEVSLNNSDDNGLTSLKHIELPDSVTYFGGCQSNSDLESVKLSKGLQEIGEDAFYECTNLQSIDIPEGTKSIGRYAFYGCTSLKSIRIPKSLTKIESEETVFADCRSLEKFEVEEGNPVFYTRNDALYENCTRYDYVDTGKFDEDGDPVYDEIEKEVSSLISYPAGKKGTFTLGKDEDIQTPATAFLNASGLTAIYVDKDNSYYTSIDGVLYNKNLTTLEVCPAGKTGEVKVAEGTELLQTNAFSMSHISSLKLSDSVKYSGYYQFYLSTDTLKSLYIGKSYEDPIYYFDMEDMPNLTSVEVSDDNAKYASIDNIIYTKDMTELLKIPGGYQGKLTIPDSVKEINSQGGAATITELRLGAGLERRLVNEDEDDNIDGTDYDNLPDNYYITIPNVSFINTQKYSVSDANPYVTAVDGVLYSADMKYLIAVPRKPLTDLVISDKCVCINGSAFSNCEYKTITIPKSVKNIWVSISRDEDEEQPLQTIYGYKGTAAETFAQENNINFVALDDSVVTPSPSADAEVSPTPSEDVSVVTPSPSADAKVSPTPSEDVSVVTPRPSADAEISPTPSEDVSIVTPSPSADAEVTPTPSGATSVPAQTIYTVTGAFTGWGGPNAYPSSALHEQGSSENNYCAETNITISEGYGCGLELMNPYNDKFTGSADDMSSIIKTMKHPVIRVTLKNKTAASAWNWNTELTLPDGEAIALTPSYLKSGYFAIFGNDDTITKVELYDDPDAVTETEAPTTKPTNTPTITPTEIPTTKPSETPIPTTDPVKTKDPVLNPTQTPTGSNAPSQSPDSGISPSPSGSALPDANASASPDTTKNPSYSSNNSSRYQRPATPAKGAIKKIKTKRNGVTIVKIKNIWVADYYEVQYSTKKKFSGKHTTICYGTSNTLYLKSRKTYYIRVRAVRNGNYATSYRYVKGNWSKIKKVRTK